MTHYVMTPPAWLAPPLVNTNLPSTRRNHNNTEREESVCLCSGEARCGLGESQASTESY